MAGAGFLPFLGMVLVQVGFAGMNITSKLAMDTGMNPFILVAYRQIFATAGLAPLAFFLERNTRPRITSSTLLQIFLCSILGVTGNQIFYYVGLKNTTTTVGAALNNVLPAITFIFAVFFRLETVGLKSTAGQAKVMGTIVCVCGAMLLSFYRGSVIDIGESHIHWKLTDGLRINDPSNEGHGFVGPMLIIASCVSWAAWFILQARLSEKFAVPYTSTALMCFMGGIQCTIIAGFSDHSVSAWSLTSNMRLVASIYAGLVGSALAFCLMTWCIQKKGPLYVSVFNPLLLVIVAATNWAFFKEQLYIGTVEGSLLIVAGLYAVLWGKEREAVSKLHEEKEVAKQGQRKDLEMQMTIDYDDIKPIPTAYKESGKGREIDAKF